MMNAPASASHACLDFDAAVAARRSVRAFLPEPVPRALLEHIVPALRPGGRLIYAVCTLTRRETTELANAFGAAHPELEPTPLFGLPEGPASVTLWPQELEANGMFLAAWRRR